MRNFALAAAVAAALSLCAVRAQEASPEGDAKPDQKSIETAVNEAFEWPEGYAAVEGPVKLSRGVLEFPSTDPVAIDAKRRCEIFVDEWGWDKSGCGQVDAMILSPTAAIDNMIVNRPNSDGYVTFDDWRDGDRDKHIDQIWNDLKLGLKEQGQRLGVEIVADSWFVYPTLNEDEHYLYYATLTRWDGAPVMNVEVSKFDRRGYVSISFVPNDETITADDLRSEVEMVLAAYKPSEEEGYLDFKDGDKIAAAGALGVLATLAGVKFGKAAAGGLIAVLLVAFKKLWFLLLAPLAFLRNLIFKKKD